MGNKEYIARFHQAGDVQLYPRRWSRTTVHVLDLHVPMREQQPDGTEWTSFTSS